MADIDLDFRVTTSGTLFSVAATRSVMNGMEDDIERTVARQGEDDVRQALHQVLKNPTGFYESNITVERQNGDWQVFDNWVVYGPWLEGVGSRNATTRFKGYFTFRRVAQALEAKAGRIADRVASRHARRLN